MPKSILFLVASTCLGALSLVGAEPNVANPKTHPYADVNGGRDTYRLADEIVNEARLYDFYQRQADYYMTDPNELPAILPAYPGLDGALYGHWGKHNQNNHEDTRWNDVEMGEVITQVLRSNDFVVLKGISVRLGNDRELSACFDPVSLTWRAIWEDGGVKFEGFRWGTSRNARPDGDLWFTVQNATRPEDSEYLGFRRFGKRVVFNYRIGKTEIEDEAWATGDAFFRRIDLKNADPQITIPMPVGDDSTATVEIGPTMGTAIIDGGNLIFSGVAEDTTVVIRILNGTSNSEAPSPPKSLLSARVVTRRWDQEIEMPVSLGNSSHQSAYAMDTFEVPFDNPWNVVMQLSGIAFLDNSDALVSTLVGDIWRVSGMGSEAKTAKWTRFATGLNQPVGIHIDEDGIFVLDRGQIYRLHDTNHDGEADFYENYANDFGGYDRSHTHTFGLHRTKDGAFHFTQRESILRTAPEGMTTLQGWGVRNCMGIGGSDDYFWVAPQEGTWTPTSEIIEVKSGEFYGLPTKGGKSGSIASPLCFIPRGVDNSTGGMVEVTSSKWGPFQGSHIGMSYGYGMHYLILRDAAGSRPQGAVVPLEGEFRSGAMRGAFSPKDGQLYVVGLDGWGDYSIEDGCLQRIRYTGNPVRKPKGFQVHENGIRIDFTTTLNPKAAEDVTSFFGQAWNYEYAKRYGSPEFSAKHPKSLGHDPIEIRSVTLLEGNTSIFVEMPSLAPVMQLHLRMHLESAAGHAFSTDLFASPMYPSAHFNAEGLEPPREGKSTAISLRVAMSANEVAKNTESGETIEGERLLLVDAIGGLQYAQKELVAKTGEALVLKLRNTDVMPHNLVIVAPGGAEAVGEASFKMLNDPAAGEKNYVPDLPQVLQHIPVINPDTEHSLHFRAPDQPGDYPYICTFPGHWLAMQGVLKVE